MTAVALKPVPIPTLNLKTYPAPNPAANPAPNTFRILPEYFLNTPLIRDA